MVNYVRNDTTLDIWRQGIINGQHEKVIIITMNSADHKYDLVQGLLGSLRGVEVLDVPPDVMASSMLPWSEYDGRSMVICCWNSEARLRFIMKDTSPREMIDAIVRMMNLPQPRMESGVTVMHKPDWAARVKHLDRSLVMFMDPADDIYLETIMAIPLDLDVPVFTANPTEFKFLMRKVRKFFDLNGLPEFVYFVKGEPKEYEFLRGYYCRTHRGSMPEEVSDFVDHIRKDLDVQE